MGQHTSALHSKWTYTRNEGLVLSSVHILDRFHCFRDCIWPYFLLGLLLALDGDGTVLPTLCHFAYSRSYYISGCCQPWSIHCNNNQAFSLSPATAQHLQLVSWADFDTCSVLFQKNTRPVSRNGSNGRASLHLQSVCWANRQVVKPAFMIPTHPSFPTSVP